MIEKIVSYSISHKLIILLFIAAILLFGFYSLSQIPIGAVPDVTNNQVQVITTSRNLSTEDVEKYLTYPVELEMANLPGVTEIRSISKFGLSVVTIVFDDDMGTYLPRQLIAEKLKSAEEKIPNGFGSPFMGPISTGLGEIYQYIIDTKEGYKNKYSITDLRTIQDWIVRRQLSGIKGVVEVNTWGGYLKQYEVAINPQRLRAVGVTLLDVYNALEKNNSIAGGGYIEKTNQSYFVRGEGLAESYEDIENIVISNKNGNPIFIRDVAEVGEGHATRFGAITANGEGEKVLGQVMMLKDANSKATIDRVKERVIEIQKSLPEGVIINGFLDRSELIGKTTYTISENLILGFLIVIFVVVLLLGNIRSALVVASVIPLSLLFAISLMYIFGVDANLMSLGAIDFGIIIDGAVIIVEFIAFKITSQRDELNGLVGDDRKSLIDRIVKNSTTKMTHSAIFGQIIIIIVFIPILSLTGVEGKMFKPMALVFSFALIGTMIFGFTYVPVIAALFLKPSNESKNNVSKKFMAFLMKMYKPSIEWALKRRKLVLILSVVLLAVASFAFSRMGAEFVPTLDEGDFVIQPVLKTGTSLTKTINTITEMEKILKGFPEVKNVVSRIGAAEVPTDPMSMEESDVIITLKPKSEWTSAESKDELADKFKEALSVIPGIDYEFTQPIEMRFNELITGVRADLAIKVFGDDLEMLSKLASKIEDAIQNVPGASDVIVEKTEGLPQMSITYNRNKIAKYGLNVADLNEIISMGFAGKAVGTIFEGEKQFDLVIRLNNENRKSIDDLKNVLVSLPNGASIPLSELANIENKKSPAKISRDETRRRIVIGVNVRNRDLASVVQDVQKIINEKIEIPVGYTVSYGGQFENLENAKSRLAIAVPIALFLIFVLLHFAFGSFRDAVIIYSAIPFAAVGGVFFLFLRDLPFSISAGVGFIALFGIAVLNGIVLIEHFKELKEQGIEDVRERILLGTKDRLRPVLLTAGAAALGFLPMAVSTLAGAEVQRPLATVVIGGLITSTLLTMIVLPVLYSYLEGFNFSKMKSISKGLPFFLVLLFPINQKAQSVSDSTNYLTLENAINIAVENNANLKSANLSVEKASKVTSLDFPKTNFYYSYDENNIAENNLPLKIFGLSQSFDFPTLYFSQNSLNNLVTEGESYKYQISLDKLKKDVSIAYYDVIYWQNVYDKYLYLDSLMNNFSSNADLKFKLGESNNLERLMAHAKKSEIEKLHLNAKEKLDAAVVNIQSLLQIDKKVALPKIKFNMIEENIGDSLNVPQKNFLQNQIKISDQAINIEAQKFLPEFSVNVFRGSNEGLNAKNYYGFDVGVSLPILFFGQKSRTQTAMIQKDISQQIFTDYKFKANAEYNKLTERLKTLKSIINKYNVVENKLAEQLLTSGGKAFETGEIEYVEYIQLIQNSISLEMSYLENVREYNNTLLQLKYFVINE
ncbi:MAG: CusA/CzcA family heavy metal efflux RND transporter [Ignavibacteriales bacterium]|nr:CusA/CzcA family heavy metal efflux RND transporter [Ignavibacteriales bacterium]